MARLAMVLLGALVVAAAAVGCGPRAGGAGGPGAGPSGSLSLWSPDFPAGGPIPARFTCDGAGQAPALAWSPPPRGTRSLALLLVDPDAPGGAFVHWVLWGLAPDAGRLPEGATGPALPAGVREGRNGFGRIGYGGPCPPRGQRHRYVFHLYALDDVPALPPGADAAALEAATAGHVLAEGVLQGTYGR
jgi:Raf kinase inhibitor-like YbhB/YbcL family protein